MCLNPVGNPIKHQGRQILDLNIVSNLVCHEVINIQSHVLATPRVMVNEGSRNLGVSFYNNRVKDWFAEQSVVRKIGCCNNWTIIIKSVVKNYFVGNTCRSKVSPSR